MSELIIAGTSQDDIHLSFEEDAANTSATAPVSLWSRMGNFWARQNTRAVAFGGAPAASNGKGATVTVRADEHLPQARALLDQHGAYFV